MCYRVSAVSYTHLDVYKRQDWKRMGTVMSAITTAVSWSTGSKIFPWTSTTRLWHRREALIMRIDVYKRQPDYLGSGETVIPAELKYVEVKIGRAHV